MFSVYHFIWLFICAAVMTAAIIYLKRNRISLDKLLTVCCYVCVASELIKVFSTIEMVPSADGLTMYPYIKLQHLPFHLCSLHLFTIFYVKFAKKSKLRDTLLAFMYPTCVAGAFFALMIPTILGSSIRVDQAFTHPLGYQFFLYHSMLIVLGLYIFLSGEVDLKPRHALSSIAILGTLGFISIYINSMFASPTYINGELVSLDYVPNFLFTFETPIGIALTKLWHWYLYFGIIATLAVVLILALYIPVFLRAKKKIS